MENTTAFATLTQIITFISCFLTSKIIFGFSFLQLVSYVTIIGLVISIFLGGVLNTKNSKR